MVIGWFCNEMWRGNITQDNKKKKKNPKAKIFKAIAPIKKKES